MVVFCKCKINNGGGTQIRTGDKGFADPCLTTWPCRHLSHVCEIYNRRFKRCGQAK